MISWAIGTVLWDAWLKRRGKETLSEWLGRHPEVVALMLGVLYYHLNPRRKHAA